MIEVLGYTGIAVVLVAYYLVSTGKLAGTSYWSNAANIVGAVLVGANVYAHQAYASFVLQCAWFALGAYAVARKYAIGRKTASGN